MQQDLSRAGRPKPLRRTAARSFYFFSAHAYFWGLTESPETDAGGNFLIE